MTPHDSRTVEERQQPTPPHGNRTPTLAPGTAFGDYEIVRCVGVGGMGCVYEAMHTLMRRRVALKTLHPELTARADFRARFLREGETLARIRHPNVVDITDVGVQDGLSYLVMEFLEGESLHSLLWRELILEERRIANLMLPLIDALGAAHGAGVVHRDIKPENIYLARDGKGDIRPMLLDFGICKVEGTPKSMELSSGGIVLGTPFYMAPEQVRRGHVDWRTDQYALGVVLYECATGRLPFSHTVFLHQMNAIVAGVYEHPCAARPGLSPRLAEVIVRAMALDPARRFDSLDALGRALLPLASVRVRAYYEAVFAEDRSAADSTLPSPPVFDETGRITTSSRRDLTPPRTQRFVVPSQAPADATPYVSSGAAKRTQGDPSIGTAVTLTEGVPVAGPPPSATSVDGARPRPRLALVLGLLAVAALTAMALAR